MTVVVRFPFPIVVATRCEKLDRVVVPGGGDSYPLYCRGELSLLETSLLLLGGTSLALRESVKVNVDSPDIDGTAGIYHGAYRTSQGEEKNSESSHNGS